MFSPAEFFADYSHSLFCVLPTDSLLIISPLRKGMHAQCSACSWQLESDHETWRNSFLQWEKSVYSLNISTSVACSTFWIDTSNFICSFWKVRDVRIISDRNSRRSKGIAYIEFVDATSVPLAIGLSGQRLLGVPIIVQASQVTPDVREFAVFGCRCDHILIGNCVWLPGWEKQSSCIGQQLTEGQFRTYETVCRLITLQHHRRHAQRHLWTIWKGKCCCLLFDHFISSQFFFYLFILTFSCSYRLIVFNLWWTVKPGDLKDMALSR